MNLPIQVPPVIRGVSATKLKGENGVEISERGTCWSARNCSGKVLNHKDNHNCCNSGGKSWIGDIEKKCRGC